MNVEQMLELEHRALAHAALADVTRLRIVDILSTSDASSSELARILDIPSNLLAHHTKALEEARLVVRHRSEGDKRRSYLHLVASALDLTGQGSMVAPARVVFVCTANSARSHLAAALWAQASDVPSASAGTHPAQRVDRRARAAATRHHLPLLADAKPRLLTDVEEPGDLVVTVCDRAHEELANTAHFHWSVPDPVRQGKKSAFDTAYDVLAARVALLAPRLAFDC